MGETLPLFTPLFNKSVQIESRPEHLTGESGALIQREIMERSGIIDWLAARLHDPRKPELITYPLSDLLRTHLLLLGQGWRDQDDADRLRQDPGLRVANSARRGTTPLDEEHVLASQPTLSRLVSLLSTDSNRTVLRQAIAELAGRRLRLDNKGHRKQTMTIDVDSLPVEVHGQQFGSEWNGHYHRRMYHPLVASCAETGDMLDGLLRPGNVHTAEGALGFILELVDRCKATLCRSAIVRIDAGFPDNDTLSGLESRKVPYVARIRNNHKRVFDLVKDFGTSESPKSTRSSTTHWCPGRPGHPAFRHNIASSLRLHTGLPYDWTPHSDAPLGSPLAPSARRVSRVASRLPGTTRLRFALHGGQRVLGRLAEPYLKRPPGRSPQTPREWCYEESYQAGTWEKPRRVVLVVVERPGDLFLDHFWLITSLDEKRYPADKLLTLYRKRGKAEAHMGELMDVLDPALSSARRSKKDDPVAQASTDTGVRPNNETLFLLNLLAYEILHMGRTLMEKATREGWSLRRFRERILRVASRVICHGRRLTFVIAQSAADDWQKLWRKLNRLRWASG